MSNIGKARDYAREQEREVRKDIIGKKPSFLLQAVPIEPLHTPWSVLDPPIKDIIYGRTGRTKDDRYSLASDKEPIQTKNGAKGCGQNDYGLWLKEVYRNGYIQVIFHIQEPLPPEQGYSLDEAHYFLFDSFCDFCSKIWDSTKIDLPYLFLFKYVNARGTKFYTGGDFNKKFTSPYNEDEIPFPERTRKIGEDLEEILKTWDRELFNAFGLKWPGVRVSP